VAHGHIERDTRPQARLLKDHAQYFAFEIGRIAFFKIFFFKFDS
jgi:hypothetical protein